MSEDNMSEPTSTELYLNVESYKDASIFTELKDEWNALLGRSYADVIFLTYEWQSIWWDTYCPGELNVVTCRDDAGQLIGIAPLYLVDGTYHLIGGEDVTDYLDLIVDEGYIPAVFEAFATYFKQHHYTLNICNIRADSPTLAGFSNYLTSQGATVVSKAMEVCPIINLPDSWDGYLALLDKKQRHELRRKQRRILGGEQDVKMFRVGADDDLDDFIARFMKLMALSDPQKEIFLQNDQHVEFFKRFSRIALDKGWLHLNFLTVDGEDAAAYFNFDYGNHILVYNSGLSLEKFGHLSPGIALLAQNIQEAIDNQYEVFDFLRGDESYKYYMGGQNTDIYRMTVTF
jgi:CelD/BcsL family acetyltransferase involved in cellulose biosynthesis